MHIDHVSWPVTDFATLAKTSVLFKVLLFLGTIFQESRGYFFTVSGAFGGYRLFSTWMPQLFAASSQPTALKGAYKRLGSEMIVLMVVTCIMWPVLALIDLFWDSNLQYYSENFGPYFSKDFEIGKSGLFRSSFYMSPTNTLISTVPIVSCICLVLASLLLVLLHRLLTLLYKPPAPAPAPAPAQPPAYPTYRGAFRELRCWLRASHEAHLSVWLAVGLLVCAVVVGACLRAPMSYFSRQKLDQYMITHPEYALNVPFSCTTTTLQCQGRQLHASNVFLFDPRNAEGSVNNHRPCINTKGGKTMDCSASNIHWNTWFFLYFINTLSGDMAGVWPHITYYFGGMVVGLVYAVTVANTSISVRAKTQFMWVVGLGGAGVLWAMLGVWYGLQVRAGHGFYARYARYHASNRDYASVHNNAWPFRLPVWTSRLVFKDGQPVPEKMMNKYNIPTYAQNFRDVAFLVEQPGYHSGGYALWQTGWSLVCFSLIMYWSDFSKLARRSHRQDDPRSSPLVPFWASKRVPMRWFRRASTYSMTIFLVDYYVYPAVSAIGGHLMATQQDIDSWTWGGPARGRFAYWNVGMSFVFFYVVGGVADVLFAGYLTWDWAFSAVQRLLTTIVVLVSRVLGELVLRKHTPDFWSLLWQDTLARLRPILSQPPRRHHTGIQLVNVFGECEELPKLFSKKTADINGQNTVEL